MDSTRIFFVLAVVVLVVHARNHTFQLKSGRSLTNGPILSPQLRNDMFKNNTAEIVREVLEDVANDFEKSVQAGTRATIRATIKKLLDGALGKFLNSTEFIDMITSKEVSNILNVTKV